ncbi:MAG: class I SAM-dependent methyltransferase [Verrucomicrobiota bacterium]
MNFIRAAVTLNGSMSEGQSIAPTNAPPTTTRQDQADGFQPRSNPNGELWERQVAAWNRLGAPLRPSAEDIAAYETIVETWSRQHGPPRGLVLGATPELARLLWPTGSNVLAVDRSREMIQHIWPGHPSPGQGGLCSDWLNLPLADQSRDLVLGDGPFTQLSFPDGYQSVAHSIRRVLAANGRVIIRFFTRPEVAEAPEAVFADLGNGRIRSFHAFKLRLAMALQERVEQGVQLQTIWNYWADAVSPSELTNRLGWRPEVISTMENYRGLAVRYTFPTLDELRRVLNPYLTESKCLVPEYELGERCPILTFRPAPLPIRPQRVVTASKLENQ